MFNHITNISEIKVNLQQIRFTSVRSRVRTPEVERNEAIKDIADKLHTINVYTNTDLNDFGMTEVSPQTKAAIAKIQTEIKEIAAKHGIEV